MHYPDPRQLDLVEYLRSLKEPRYSATTLAAQYGLSRGQARTLIELHGPMRHVLDAVMALKTSQ